LERVATRIHRMAYIAQGTSVGDKKGGRGRGSKEQGARRKEEVAGVQVLQVRAAIVAGQAVFGSARNTSYNRHEHH